MLCVNVGLAFTQIALFLLWFILRDYFIAVWLAYTCGLEQFDEAV